MTGGGVAERLLRVVRGELAGTLAGFCAEVEAAESSILLPRGETELVFFASSNPQLVAADVPAVPINASFSGLAFRTGQTLAYADAASQARHFKSVDERVGVQTRKFAAIAIAERATVGVLTMVNRAGSGAGAGARGEEGPRPFGRAELLRAEAFARELAGPVGLLAALAGLSPGGAEEELVDPELLADLRLLNDGERRVVQALAASLMQNRVE